MIVSDLYIREQFTVFLKDARRQLVLFVKLKYKTAVSRSKMFAERDFKITHEVVLSINSFLTFKKDEVGCSSEKAVKRNRLILNDVDLRLDIFVHAHV